MRNPLSERLNERLHRIVANIKCTSYIHAATHCVHGAWATVESSWEHLLLLNITHFEIRYVGQAPIAHCPLESEEANTVGSQTQIQANANRRANTN